MNHDDDELRQRLGATLERSTRQLDDDTVQSLAQVRQQALAGSSGLGRYRPALAAAVVMALVATPWLVLQSPPDAEPVQASAPQDLEFLNEDPDMLATWDMLEAIGEVPDA